MICIFDLDDTIIDSGARTPMVNGSLDLPAYLALATPANIRRDKLLPAVRLLRQCYDAGHTVWILTARGCIGADYAFLARHNIPYHKIMSRDQCKPWQYRLKDGDYKMAWLRPLLNLRQYRGKPMVMFDDSSHVKTVLRENGIPVICAHKVNAKLKG